MAYQALYRKWRPTVFDDVVGQQHITETLRRQVETNRLSHAYLFVGTRGTGKTTCAKILSRAVNCEHPVNGNPCNVCASCRGIESGSVLEVEEIDAASNNGVDNIRMLREEAVFSPASVRRRVYIIDEVHMLSLSAFNALLKILEEPPEHLLFILATTELNKVPATILSRCQRFQFKRILPEDISRRLSYVAKEEGLELTAEGAALLARLADGGMRDALSLLDQCSGGVIDEERILSAIGLTGARETVKLFECIRKGALAEALSLVDGLYRNGKDLNAMLGELQSLERDILLYQLTGAECSGLVSGMFAMNVLADLSKKLAPAEAMGQMEILQTAIESRSSAGSVRLNAELAVMKLCSAKVRSDADGLAARVDALEKLLADGIPLAASSAQRMEKPGRIPQQKVNEPSPASDLPWSEDDSPPPPDDRDMPPADDGYCPPPSMEEPKRATPSNEPKGKATEKAARSEKAKHQPLTPTVSGGSEDWKRVLDALQGLADTPTYTMLNDPTMYEGRIAGNRYLVYCLTPFAKLMADQTETLEWLRRAVETAIGRSMPVALTEDSLPAAAEAAQAEITSAAEDDPLNQLMSFNNVEFTG